MGPIEWIIIAMLFVIFFGSSTLLWFKSGRFKSESDLKVLQSKLDEFEKSLQRNEKLMREEMQRSREEAAKSARELREEIASSIQKLKDTL